MAMHNRYARTGSFEEPPRVSKGRFEAYHPVDASSKGTWVGFNKVGLFAAATDQHTDGPLKAYRSRGLLLMDVLTHFSKASEAADYMEMELTKGYRRGNFLLADSREAFHILKDERVEITPLNPGVHIFTNLTVKEWVRTERVPEDLMKYVEMRRKRAVELASQIEPKGLKGVLEELRRVASDHGEERGRGSICYHGEVGWYMSSSTIMAVAKNLGDSRILYCRGNPCEGRFIDYSHILPKGGGDAAYTTVDAAAPVIELSKESMKLSGKRVALCLTGSVATIEAPKLARWLRRHGAEVQCYMTSAAVEYGVSPKVMEWATGRPVVLGLTGAAEHLVDYDLVLVYPATLNTVCKVARGVADNAVTTLCASTSPTRLVVAPAMNLRLYMNAAFREALKRLKRLGVTLVEPRISEGAAKVASVEKAVDYVIRSLSTSILKGRGILILTGPTRYDIDPVRYVSNKASGKIGYWLAKEAFQRGCEVKVIYGPGTVRFPEYIPVVKVYTVEEMLKAALTELETGRYEVAVFSAAILDFKPATYEAEKVKSGAEWTVNLIPTVKVIGEVSRRYPDVRIVGFKLEYKVSREELIRRAQDELERVKAAIIVANDLSEIRGECHKAYLIDQRGRVRDFDGKKAELAGEILNLLEENLTGRSV